ncbi:fatty acid elongase 3-like [Silene latifolia]|uniref:fatty acid elongase 3-like n=1 Tax=Silene latifolia TaxID=37657 RepID=UPI003D77C861
MAATMAIKTITHNLSEHPSIKNFRWSPSQSWGSTWSFLFTSITAYVIVSLALHSILCLFRSRNRPISLGPIPAVHSLCMALISASICAGILLSSAAEIRDTRWFWRRSKTTPWQWLLCFPLGTRPSGRVFFWSYVFYLSRFLHLFRTFFAILRRRKLHVHCLITHSFLIFTSFVWLEFSQSFQVLAIVATSIISAVVYGYRFWTAVGLPSACFPFVLNCQIVLLGCNLVIHVGVLLMHFFKGGCNGIGAWGFNSILNSGILLLFLNFYIKHYVRKTKNGGNDIKTTI